MATEQHTNALVGAIGNGEERIGGLENHPRTAFGTE